MAPPAAQSTSTAPRAIDSISLQLAAGTEATRLVQVPSSGHRLRLATLAVELRPSSQTLTPTLSHLLNAVTCAQRDVTRNAATPTPSRRQAHNGRDMDVLIHGFSPSKIRR